MTQFYKSVLEQDTAPVVLCDTDHIIVYMNPAACDHYAKYGGKELLGKSVLDCHSKRSVQSIEKILAWFREDISHNRVHTIFSEKENLDVYMIALRNDGGELIGYYEKLESRTRDESPLYAM